MGVGKWKEIYMGLDERYPFLYTPHPPIQNNLKEKKITFEYGTPVPEHLPSY